MAALRMRRKALLSGVECSCCFWLLSHTILLMRLSLISLVDDEHPYSASATPLLPHNGDVDSRISTAPASALLRLHCVGKMILV